MQEIFKKSTRQLNKDHIKTLLWYNGEAHKRVAGQANSRIVALKISCCNLPNFILYLGVLSV
jgi:hypothetical protein